MFEKFDGSGRAPRQVQTEVLDWIRSNWNSGQVLACNLPTGVGKSAILRSIQLEFPGTFGIVPTNILLDQYRATYSELNYIKGKEHYECSEVPGISCKEAQEKHGSKCLDCEYTINKERAKHGESTIFNPISLFQFVRKTALSDVIVVDEAHKLIDLLNMLVTVSFKRSQYHFPEKFNSSVELVQWLAKTISSMQTEMVRLSGDARAEKQDQIYKLTLVQEAFVSAPQDFVFYTEQKKIYKHKETYLQIRPLCPPKSLLNKLLGCKKLILLSATLFHNDIWNLAIRNYAYLDVPSPFGKENRKILYRPAPLPFNYRSDPAHVASYIKQIITAYPDLNTVVHLSYAWAAKVKDYFPDALFNTPANKEETLKKFKETGGLWIASGCSEGIDLPGDECRVTIIPMILKANIKDPVVAKLLAREKGQVHYELDCMKTTIQQAGRGTRSQDDYSVTIVGDRQFPRLVSSNRQYLPKSFLESIKWSINDD